jgi:hypothetical protein
MAKIRKSSRMERFSSGLKVQQTVGSTKLRIGSEESAEMPECVSALEVNGQSEFILRANERI